MKNRASRDYSGLVTPRKYFDNLTPHFEKNGFNALAIVSIDTTEFQYNAPYRVEYARTTDMILLSDAKAILVQVRLCEVVGRFRQVADKLHTSDGQHYFVQKLLVQSELRRDRQEDHHAGNPHPRKRFLRAHGFKRVDQIVFDDPYIVQAEFWQNEAGCPGGPSVLLSPESLSLAVNDIHHCFKWYACDGLFTRDPSHRMSPSDDFQGCTDLYRQKLGDGLTKHIFSELTYVFVKEYDPKPLW